MTFVRTLKSALFGVACAVAATFGASSSHAVTIQGTVPTLGVEYIFFTHNGGDLDIAVNGITLSDPMIRLMEDDGSAVGALTGSFIAVNDDGGPGLNSLLEITGLSSGQYVLAVGAFRLTRAEARSGIASTPDSPGTYEAIFTGDINIPSIPLPAAFPLLLVGLGGFYLIWRRRRTTT